MFIINKITHLRVFSLRNLRTLTSGTSAVKKKTKGKLQHLAIFYIRGLLTKMTSQISIIHSADKLAANINRFDMTKFSSVTSNEHKHPL